MILSNDLTGLLIIVKSHIDTCHFALSAQEPLPSACNSWLSSETFNFSFI